MSDTDSSELRALMYQIAEGSEEAARLVIERYGDHIRRVVRRNLRKQLRPLFDSDDFVQEVWGSFFASVAKGQSPDQADKLLPFLKALAHNMVVDANRKYLESHKYDLHREESLETLAASEEGEPAARQATPYEAAVANEEWERLLRSVPPLYQRLLFLLVQGAKHHEVAEHLGVTERTVRRMIDRLWAGLAN